MILVTGGSGFIGSQLIGKLSAEGVSVRCLRHRRSVPSGPRLEVVPGDIVSGAGLADALRGVDTVIHLAGLTKALTVAEFEVWSFNFFVYNSFYFCFISFFSCNFKWPLRPHRDNDSCRRRYLSTVGNDKSSFVSKRVK